MTSRLSADVKSTPFYFSLDKIDAAKTAIEPEEDKESGSNELYKELKQIKAQLASKEAPSGDSAVATKDMTLLKARVWVITGVIKYGFD